MRHVLIMGLLSCSLGFPHLSHAYQLHGTVRGVVDLPDYCSQADTMPLGWTKVEVPGIATTYANEDGSFNLTVPTQNPVEVIAHLRSSNPQYNFSIRSGGVAQAASECTPGGEPCDILFDDTNSEFSERTAYYWVKSIFQAVLDNEECPAGTRQALLVDVAGSACSATTNEESLITLGESGFPCGSLGRIATIIAHEMAHWLDFRSRPSSETSPEPVPVPDTDGNQGMADGMGIFVLNALQYPEEAYSVTAKGLWLNKCLTGLREHDAFKRTPEDLHVELLGNNSEILTNFYWDVAQTLPAEDALRIYLESVCETRMITSMQDAVDAFCRQSGSFSSAVAELASAHGFVTNSCLGGDDNKKTALNESSSMESLNGASPGWRIAPNPAAPHTVIVGWVDRNSALRIGIYDAAGRMVCALYNGDVLPGTYAVEWHGVNSQGERVRAGVYFAKVEQGRQSAVLKVVLLNGDGGSHSSRALERREE